jgi:HEPN domain-containing protein
MVSASERPVKVFLKSEVLTAEQRALLEASSFTRVSVWEVEDSLPGQWLRGRQSPSHNVQRTIRDPVASRTLQGGTAILARVLEVAGEAVFAPVYPQFARSGRAGHAVEWFGTRARRKHSLISPHELRTEKPSRQLILDWGRMLRTLEPPDFPPEDDEGNVLAGNHGGKVKRDLRASEWSAQPGTRPGLAVPQDTPSWLQKWRRMLYAESWMAQARDTLRTARLNRDGGQHAHACFMYQQAAELALKAGLEQLGLDHSGHNLVELLSALARARESAADPQVEAAARRLTRLYIPTRYPDAVGGAVPSTMYDQEDSQRADTDAERVFSYVSGTSDQVG